MKTIKCKNCRRIKPVKNGNSIYCDSCKIIVRNKTSSERYARVNLKADPCWLNEKILRRYNREEIDINQLESEGFNFTKFNDIINQYGEVIFQMKKFGYSYQKNKKVYVWKIS